MGYGTDSPQGNPLNREKQVEKQQWTKLNMHLFLMNVNQFALRRKEEKRHGYANIENNENGNEKPSVKEKKSIVSNFPLFDIVYLFLL